MGVIIASATGIVAGIITTFLPWHKWPRWHTHWLILVGFGLIGLGISFYGEFAYAFGAMFCICFTAVGLAHRPGTSLSMLPLFVVAYATPIAVKTGDVCSPLSFAVFIGVLCLMVAEIVSWVTSRLHRSQMALLQRACGRQRHQRRPHLHGRGRSGPERLRQAVQAARCLRRRASTRLADDGS